MHKTTKRLRTPEGVERCFPGFMSFTDCTEQQIPRPESKRRRKTHYWGKKKRHTVKTQLTVNSQGVIVHKTGHEKGKRHDYDIYKKNHPAAPKQVVSVFDLGYIGVEKDFPEQMSSLPNRKKRSQKDLSHEEKEHNQNHSRKRIVIEHTICRMKKYRIMGDIFRNRLRNYDRISDIVSGLVNYRILASSF
jgi:DDE superfamily endonuclease